MQQMLACPNCGAQNASNQQYCVSCGAHLGGGPRVAPHVPIVTGVAAPPPVMQQQAVSQSGPVDIKATWGLAWGLFWRTVCLFLFTGGVIFLVYMLVRMALGYTSLFGTN